MSFKESDISEIQEIGSSLGFLETKLTDVNLSEYHQPYKSWIEYNYHGSMSYMVKHGDKRLYPEKLIPNTKSIIVVAYNYFNSQYAYKNIKNNLNEVNSKAVISQYAVGRDYHKVVKKKLAKLVDFIHTIKSDFECRIFTDSGPVLEKPIAEKAGVGYIGKNSLLIHPQHGSFFFLGIIYCNQELPRNHTNTLISNLCQSCQACIKICPTNAILSNKTIDSRKCISYLTIENKGAIPHQYRKAIGTRIYGCDDCQVICPWNKGSKITHDDDFFSRPFLKDAGLIDLLSWDESTFLKNNEGSAIRRIGYLSWVRNIAVALGNTKYSSGAINALKDKRKHINNDMVDEHIIWAISELEHNKFE
jgi:epoxyqueuosine reductase